MLALVIHVNNYNIVIMLERKKEEKKLIDSKYSNVTIFDSL